MKPILPPLLLASALLWLSSALAAAHADTSPAQGRSLVVSQSCSDSALSIVPEADLNGVVLFDGPLHDSRISDDGAIIVEPGCKDSDPLTIRVPPAFPVTLDSSGGGALHLGDLAGTVTISMRGSGDLAAGHLSGPVTISTRGSGDVAIAQASGPALTLDSAGSADIAVGRIAVGILAIHGAGSGDFNVGPGTVGGLQASLAGGGDLTVRATIAGGAVNLAGSSDATLAKVTGHLERSHSGSSSLRILNDEDPADSFKMPPMPAMPTIPSMTPTPQIQAPALDLNFTDGRHHSHFDWRRDRTETSSGIGWSTAALSAAAVAILAFVAWRRFASARARPAAAVIRNEAIGALSTRLEALARRTGRIETWVTTKEFELHRDFREIGDD